MVDAIVNQCVGINALGSMRWDGFFVDGEKILMTELKGEINALWSIERFYQVDIRSCQMLPGGKEWVAKSRRVDR